MLRAGLILRPKNPCPCRHHFDCKRVCYHGASAAQYAAQGARLPARILNGNAIRDQIYSELSGEIAALSASGIRPGLAAVLVGENPASKIYVSSKIAATEKLGLASFNITPPATISTSELLAIVEDLNRRDDIDGILVQLPLPSQIDAKEILEAVDPAKDVDGFHPLNVGRLVAGRPNLVACTPLGVMEILRRSEVPIEGANAAVLGRSDIVGKPMALLLMHANATVTVCHSKTRNLRETVRRADIVIAAMGRTAMVTPDYIASGATVIDVGINRITDVAQTESIFANLPERLASFRAKGSAVVGDVHPDVANIAGAITPVPGGVGPLTIAMLMSNTVRAARLRRGARISAAARS
jgi:methylenetetrahydrofolate dehydrogenase (NADP+)/methenyltetrahydrofolate cyclohydrolase